MRRNGHLTQRRNPSHGWGFCCWRDQKHGQGMAPHELDITKQRSIIPVLGHWSQSAHFGFIPIRAHAGQPDYIQAGVDSIVTSDQLSDQTAYGASHLASQ